jgi:hypothetical protein
MSRIFVILATLFMFGGVAYAFQPDLFSANGLKLEGAAAISDVRTMYGTLPFALGVFLAPGALRKTGHLMELRLITFIFAGLVAGRILGLILDKGDQSFTQSAFVFEGVVLVVSGILLQREMTRKPA